MPKLPGAEDLGGVVSGRSGRAVASVDMTAIGRGIATLGAGISSMGDSLRVREAQTKEKVDQATRFETERRFLQFEQQRGLALQEMGQKEQPGAFGFRERYQEDYLTAAREFYQSVPEDLRPAYDVKLMQTERRLLDGDGGAGAFERTARSEYYKTNVADGLTQFESRLYQNPSQYEDLVWEAEQFIDAIPDEDVSPIEKDALRRNVQAKFRLAALNGMAPTERLRALGEMPANDDILRAIENVESNGNPDAVSPVGAIGLMQVMPGTGQEVAEELGDRNFPTNGGIDRITAYLKQPEVSRAYGAHYFNKMMARYDGDVEAALVAYNGGPGRADRWLAAGRNDAVIPKESADYYKKVLGRVEGAAPGPRDTGADLPVITVDQAGRSGSPDVGRVQPVVLDRFKQLQNSFGASIPIVSGFRDPERNARAGGASQSRHMHGDALDLDVSKLSTDERARLIQQASAAGFTGIGVYNNSIHIDLGGRRAWGPSHKSDSVPGWAKGAIDQHLANRAPQDDIYGSAGYRVDPRFAGMSYQDRETMAAATREEIAAKRSAAAVLATANYKAYDDAFALNIELGNVVSEEQILGDPRLEVSDITKHLKRFRQVQEETADVRDLVSAIVNGDGAAAVNGFDADERGVANKAYESMMKAADEQTAPIIADTFVRATGFIPNDIQAELRQGAASTDPTVLAATLSRADALQIAAPISFDAFEGGKDVRDRLAAYRHFVNDLGMAGDAAAERILAMNDPARRVSREVLKTDAAAFVKTLTVDEVTNAFDPGLLSREPGAGVMPAQVNGLLAEYREVAEEAFYEAGGDAGVARSLALSEMKKRWNVSGISGSANLMRMPPELHYPTVDGTHDYLREDALASAKAFVEEAGLGHTVENIAILPTAQTRADVEAGRLPRYRLFYMYEQDGQTRINEATLGPWGIDRETVQGLARDASQKRRSEFMQRRVWSVEEADRRARNAAMEDAAIPAAERALEETVGPDWMRARAAEAEMERGRAMQTPSPLVRPGAAQANQEAADEVQQQREQFLDRERQKNRRLFSIGGSSTPNMVP